MAIKQFTRLIRRPQPSSGNGSSVVSQIKTQSIKTMLACTGLMMLSLLLGACSAPSTQRFAFAVRDSKTALPVVGAHATVTLSRQPFWFDGQPVYLTTDNVGMDHALLVLYQTAYQVKVTREGYEEVCFDLPAFNNHFPYGLWLSSIKCVHPFNAPCTDACLVSHLELMVTEPMPE